MNRKKYSLYKKDTVFLLLILLIFCILISGCSSNKRRYELMRMDENVLEEELYKENDTSRKVDIYNEMAYRWRRKDSSKAIDWASKADKLAKNLGYQRGVVDSLCNRGVICFYKSEYSASKNYYETGLELAKIIHYSLGEAAAYNGIGRYYQARREYATALDNFIKSQEICENISDPRELAGANYGFGALYYYDQKDYTSALKYFKKNIEMGRKINDDTIITGAYYAIGEMYLNMGDKETAKKNFENCLSLSKENNDIYNEANAYEGLGDWYKIQSDYKNAFEYYFKSKYYFERLGDGMQKAEILKRMGILFNLQAAATGKNEFYQTALEYLKESLDIAKIKKIPSTIVDVSEEMIKSYIALGEYVSALDIYKVLLENKDFLKKNEMLRVKVIFDFEKRSETERFKTIFWITVAGSLFIGFAFLLLYLIELIRKNRTVENLNEIGQAITSSLSVKEIIERVYDNVNRLMAAKGFYIGIYNEMKQRLELSDGKEFGKRMDFHYNDLSDKNRLSVKCFVSEIEIKIDDYEREYSEYINEDLPVKVGNQFKSHIFLPLIAYNEQGMKKKIGVLIVQSDKKRAYTDYHLNILRNLAIYTAIALDNANAYKKIDEQKKKVEKALRLEQDIIDHKDILIYTVSHQFKTPLAIIDESIQILKFYYSKLTQAEIHDHFKVITTNLERMLNMIDKLLKLGEVFNPGNYNLSEICKTVIAEVKSGEGSKNDINFYSECNCNRVWMDKDLMIIAIHNIITNSIKYSPAGSRIVLELLCDSDYAIIKIEDNGNGIPEDELEHVWVRFNRGANVKNIPGTGLGLAIVKRYVELHGGEKHIESKVGEGTTVTIKIPKNG